MSVVFTIKCYAVKSTWYDKTIFILGGGRNMMAVAGVL